MNLPVTAPEGYMRAKKIKVGGVGHFGEYCIVRYGRKNYFVYPAGDLFSAGKTVYSTENLALCVTKVYMLQGNKALRVTIDNG